jgi:uncharacterized damage-inducible protein DinB
MRLAETFLMELTHEAAGARKALERLPEAQFGWQPHEKSMTAGRLAGHIAEIPRWLGQIVGQHEFFMDPAEFQPNLPRNRTELLKSFDESLKAGTAALKGASDEALMANWKMKTPERTVVDMPRAAVIRAWVLNHLVHHRGQLTVYLRLLGAPVPALYGPSADEQG